VRDGRKIEVRVHSQLRVNNAAAFIAEDLARSSIASGKLARIL
jgi:hypothetical protein